MERIKRIGALVAVFVIALVLSARPLLLATGLLIIVAWSLIVDVRALRRVAKIKFWIMSLVIALLAGLLLGKNTQSVLGIPLSLDGLSMGFMMILRAFTLITAGAVLFHAAGREQFMAFTQRIGLRHFDPAFAAAMDTLPKVKTTWQNVRTEERSSRFRAAARLLLAFADLAQVSSPRRTRFFAITGGIGRGKSTLLRRLADEARSQNIAVGGFSQQRTESGDRVIYELVRVSGERAKLGERGGGKDFRFEENAFAVARSWLQEDARSAKLFFIDELGKLEAEGGGHVPALQELLAARPDAIIVAVIRKEKLPVIREFFPFDNDHLFDLDERADQVEGFQQSIIEAIRSELSRRGESPDSPE